MKTDEAPVRVLIVDDDESILALLGEVFRGDKDLLVRTESDSSAASEYLEQESYDLLITDLMMPGVDGLVLLERARVLHPDILVVIITGYASLETTLKAIHAGAYDYITKPFRLEEFRLLVNNAAARIRLMKQVGALDEERRSLEKRLSDLEGLHRKQELEVARLHFELEQCRLQSVSQGEPQEKTAR